MPAMATTWDEQADEVWSKLPDNATREETVAMYAIALQDEYEHGKQHGDEDRRLIERRNREQGLEISNLKGEIARLKLRLAAFSDPV